MRRCVLLFDHLDARIRSARCQVKRLQGGMAAPCALHGASQDELFQSHHLAVRWIRPDLGVSK